MFDNEDEFWWMDSEMEILKRKAFEKEEQERQEIYRFQTLYDYYKDLNGVSKRYVFYNKDNVNNLNKMLRIFIKIEEYEKCAVIRDWIEEINNRKEEVKSRRESEVKKAITF